MREITSVSRRRVAVGRRLAVLLAVLMAGLPTPTATGLGLPVAAGQHAGAVGGQPRAPQADEADPAPSFEEIDAQLRRAEWPAALQRLRAQAPRIAVWTGYRGDWLARVAVAEAGSGQTDQAFWHWAVAQELSPGLFPAGDLLTFGPAGALLAAHSRRQPGQAPDGMSVEPPGPAVQAAVRTQGELPQLAHGAWDPVQWLRLEAVVDTQGRLRDPVVLSARSDEAAYTALEAMRDWLFEPAKKSGQPVAMLYSLVLNPPGRLPLDKLIKLSAEAASIERMLRQQHWLPASEQAERRWYRLLDDAGLRGGQEAERAALGLTLALRALARAGQDPNEQAWVCRWQAAQSLLPGLYQLDLAPYGPAGQAVAAWRWAAFSAPRQRFPARIGAGDRSGRMVKKPEKIEAPPPYYPEAARKQSLSGKVLVEAILDDEGTVRNPVILRGLGAGAPVILAASALDAVCGWRFKPATLEGKPVKVYYTLTINFAVRPR
ncbi:MAG TPA: energy transducer TonB [Thermoanaerobaculia bacterium]|nr:energy transducer TonB [Thermoanaerobaculia bacterium]